MGELLVVMEGITKLDAVADKKELNELFREIG